MRLFVAVWPPPDVVAALRALPRPAVPGLRWTTEDQWHVTLRFLGEADEAAARAALATVAFDARPVAVVGPAVGRFGDGVLHVPVDGLDELAEAVVRATGAVGVPPPRRPFRGHLTLARANRGRAPLRGLVGTPLGGRWEVGELTLVTSRLHPRGSQYAVVERLPLPTR
ncbi:MAG TPA: RNA 2',3'-cyclic phosphodiesterase [Acidimicrobiales bacterium]|nr:RNA 2',3'-cyclic phosphodiesterase [Acidimicrobiales bacterium]